MAGLISFERMTKASAAYLVVLFAFLGTSCQDSSNAFRDQFRWLSGKWHGENEGVVLIEQWKWSNHRFEGKGYEILEGDTVTAESMYLQDFDGHIAYIVTVGGGGPFMFSYEPKDVSYRFRNPEHDFPSLIEYAPKADSAIQIHLYALGESEPAISYVLNRATR